MNFSCCTKLKLRTIITRVQLRRNTKHEIRNQPAGFRFGVRSWGPRLAATGFDYPGRLYLRRGIFSVLPPWPMAWCAQSKTLPAQPAQRCVSNLTLVYAICNSLSFLFTANAVAGAMPAFDVNASIVSWFSSSSCYVFVVFLCRWRRRL